MAQREFMDRDGDILWTQTTLVSVRFKIPEDCEYVALDVGGVRDLYSHMGEWLSQHDAGVTPQLPAAQPLPDPDAIRALARDEFEKLFTERTRPAVLPLWESPASGAVSRPCPGCTPLGCTDFSHDGPMEQEPWDVPADATEPWLGRCDCGHTRIQHNFSECMVAECTCKRTRTDLGAPVPAPRLMSAVRKRSAPAPIHCERCSHPHADHGEDGCTYEDYEYGQELLLRPCECTWSAT